VNVNRGDVAAVFALFQDNFQRDINPHAIDVWTDELKDVDSDVFERAVRQVIRIERFFPTLGTMLSYVNDERRADARSGPAANKCGCDNGWIWVNDNTVRACSKCSVHAQVVRDYDEHRAKLFGGTGVAELLDYKPVSKERAKDWMNFIRIREWDKHQDLGLGVAGMGDEVDDWIAAGRPGLDLVEAKRGRKQAAEPKPTMPHGNVFNGQSLDDFLATGKSTPNPSTEEIVESMREKTSAQDAPGSPQAGSDGSDVRAGASDAAGVRPGGTGGIGATKAPRLPSLPPNLDDWREENF
jgi:hypothetical protein